MPTPRLRSRCSSALSRSIRISPSPTANWPPRTSRGLRSSPPKRPGIWSRRRSRRPRRPCCSTQTWLKRTWRVATCCGRHAHHFAHERAAQEFRRAVALKPNSDQGHRRLARVYVHVGFFEEALRHADIALAINPSNAQALNSRAQAFLWMGKDEDALAVLLSIPGPVLPELVEANTAFALLRLGKRDDAWLHLRRAQHKYPKRSERRPVRYRGDAAGGVRAPQGSGLDREGREEEGGQSFSSRRVLRRERVGADGTCRGGRGSRCEKRPRPGFPAIRCSHAIPTWIRSARIRVSRRFSPTCRNSPTLCGRRYSMGSRCEPGCLRGRRCASTVTRSVRYRTPFDRFRIDMCSATLDGSAGPGGK